MSLDSRQTWIDCFQQVASQTELTEELATVVELLKLPLSCCLAVQQVLKEGNWAKAESPRAYVRKAAMTQARRMHLSIRHLDDTLEFGESPLIFMGGGELNRSTTREGIEKALETEYRNHGKPRPTRLKGPHYVAEQFAPDDDVLAREAEAQENGPFWPGDCWTEQKLYAKDRDESFSVHKRDWKRLGEKAGVDEWQIKVLEYRSEGISRDVAMELQPDEASRKAIQAAWKRFHRTGLRKVRDSFDKIPPWDVPEELPRDTRRMEATDCPPAGRLSVNDAKALQAIWKRKGDTSREGLGRFLSAYRAAVNGRGPTQFAASHLVKIIDSKCPE